jgi:outer membrane protein assembly factor BamB
VASAAGQPYALSLSDGSVLWEETADEPTKVGYRMRPVILGDVAVFARTDNAVEARELLTGALRWVKNRPVAVTQPVGLDPHVYFIDGPIQMLRADGSVAWQFGGLNVGVGLTFLLGRVSAEGIIYTLGQDFTGPGVTAGTFVFAIKPPVK